MSGLTKYGNSALFSNTIGDNNSAFGNFAAYNNTDASCNTAVGSNALFHNINAPHNTAIGAGAMFYNTTGQLNTAVGSSALEGPGPATSVGNQNVAIGAQALYSNQGNNNTAVGYQALLNNIDASSCNAFGSNALHNNTTGVKNVAIGYNSLYSNTIGTNNIAIGDGSLKYNENSASYNISIGDASMFGNLDGSYNTAIGDRALFTSIVGYSNIALGYRSLYNSKGNSNTGIGTEVGLNLDLSSNYNTLLGYHADVSSTTLIYNNSTALGYQATIDASNQIVLGTSAESVKIPGSYVGIGTYNPGGTYALDVSGNVLATTFSTPSDYRIKENVTQLDSKFVVDKLNPVTYLNNKLGKQDIGLIAHELQEIYPELVNGEKDGEQLQSVNYTGLIPILIKEIQVLKERVKILEERN